MLMAQREEQYGLAMPVTASWRRLLAFLVASELLLVVAYLVTGTRIAGEQMALWFDLDREPGVGAWFSSSQLLVIALVLGFAPADQGRQTEPSLWFLRLLALGFVFLSVDEAVAIHEAITVFVRKRLPGVELAWIPLYAAVTLALGAATAMQLRRVWRTCRACALLSLAGGVVYIAGAAVIEAVATIQHVQDLRWEIAAEEFAEMSGASLILCGALSLAARLRHASARLPLPGQGVPARRIA